MLNYEGSGSVSVWKRIRIRAKRIWIRSTVHDLKFVLGFQFPEVQCRYRIALVKFGSRILDHSFTKRTCRVRTYLTFLWLQFLFIVITQIIIIQVGTEANILVVALSQVPDTQHAFSVPGHGFSYGGRGPGRIMSPGEVRPSQLTGNLSIKFLFSFLRYPTAP